MRKKRRIDRSELNEIEYHASRIFKLLGNPKTYQVMMLLRELGEATPTIIQARIKRSMATTCIILKSLLAENLVKCRKKGRNTVYSIKNSQVEKLLDAQAALADKTLRPED